MPINKLNWPFIYIAHFLPLFKTISVDRFKQHKNQRVNTILFISMNFLVSYDFDEFFASKYEPCWFIKKKKE